MYHSRDQHMVVLLYLWGHPIDLLCVSNTKSIHDPDPEIILHDQKEINTHKHSQCVLEEFFKGSLVKAIMHKRFLAWVNGSLLRKISCGFLHKGSKWDSTFVTSNTNIKNFLVLDPCVVKAYLGYSHILGNTFDNKNSPKDRDDTFLNASYLHIGQWKNLFWFLVVYKQ